MAVGGPSRNLVSTAAKRRCRGCSSEQNQSFQIIPVAHTQAVHRKPRGNSASELEEGNGDTGRGDGRVLHTMDSQR